MACCRSRYSYSKGLHVPLSRLIQWVAILFWAHAFTAVVVDSQASVSTTPTTPPTPPPTTPLGNEKATFSDGGAFVSDETHRQDFCTRYKEMISEEEMTSVRNALSGMQLRISLKAGEKFRYNETHGIDPEYPGVHARILDYIALRGNFTWRESFGVWKEEEKGERTILDLLRWGVDKYDVVVGSYTPSTKRMNYGISFVKGHIDGSIIMVRRVTKSDEEEKIKWFTFMAPFERQVWWTILGILVFSSITYQYIEYLSGRFQFHDGEQSFRDWCMDNLYLSMINFTGNYSYEPTTLGGRVFGLSFAFWAMLITAAYTANLATFFVTQKVVLRPLGDINEAINERFPICVQAGAFAEDHMNKTYPESGPILVRVPTTEMYTALLENKCKVLLAYRQDFELRKMSTESNPHCDLEWQGRTVKPVVDSFVTKLDPGVKCTDLVNEVFSYYIREMEENGKLQELWDQHKNFYGTEGYCDGLPDRVNNERHRNRRLEGWKSQGAPASPTPSTSALAPALNGGARFLKAAASRGAAAATGGLAAGATRDNDDEGRLGVKEMAGSMVFHVVGCVIAVVLTLLGRVERKTNVKRALRKTTVSSETAWEAYDMGVEDCSNDDDGFSTNDSLRRQLGKLSSQLELLHETVSLMQNELNRRDKEAANRTASTMSTTDSLILRNRAASPGISNKQTIRTGVLEVHEDGTFCLRDS